MEGVGRRPFSLPLVLHPPQPSTCSESSRQQITVLNRRCPQPLPPQAREPSSQGKLTLQKVGEKGTDFLNSPGLLSSPLPSGQRHKGRCQFVRLPQAIPDLWLPTMKREAGCEKAFKVPTERMPGFLDKSFTWVVNTHSPSYSKTETCLT